MKKALCEADFVQENGPERQDFKIKLFADMDDATPQDSIIASSSSGLTMSVMQSACKHPERCVIGHPFNPPHVVPLVEVVAGAKTSPQTVEQAIAFYASIGKKPIHVRKEVVGHVANRLQAALYREIVYLIEQGVLDVADADVAVCWGPGLRWGVMGPNLLFHLGGGQGGIQHFMEQFSGPLSTWWKDLGKITEFSPEVTQTIIEGVQDEAGNRSIDELEHERDAMLLELLATRAKGEEGCSGSDGGRSETGPEAHKGVRHRTSTSQMSKFLWEQAMIYVHSLGRAARYYAMRTALAPGGDPAILLRELEDRVKGIAAALSEHGFNAGDRLALLLPNGPEYIELVYACSWLGVIAVPHKHSAIPGGNRSDTRRCISAWAGASFLVASANRADILAAG